MSSKQDFKETKKEFKNNATELGNTLDEFQNTHDVSKLCVKFLIDIYRTNEKDS